MARLLVPRKRTRKEPGNWPIPKGACGQHAGRSLSGALHKKTGGSKAKSGMLIAEQGDLQFGNRYALVFGHDMPRGDAISEDRKKEQGCQWL